MFWKSDYIFLLKQDKLIGDDNEKLLKSEIFSYVDKSIKSLFFRKKIEYIDYYTSVDNVYMLMMTSQPKKENKLLTALMLEIFAFTKTNNENIFESYNYEKKNFQNEFQKIDVFKFKLKG